MPTIDYETETEIETLANQISNFVNRHSHEEVIALGQHMTHTHRTLQQLQGSLVQAYIKQTAEEYENGFYDARNEAWGKWCAKVSKSGMDFLPFI